MSELKNWILNHGPDLRITKELVNGERCCAASLTVQGVFHEIGPVIGDDADEAIIRLVAETICETIGIPSIFENRESNSLQLEIILASLSGDDATAKALTAQYVTRDKLSAMPMPRAAKGWSVS